jgi:HSP20 family protein
MRYTPTRRAFPFLDRPNGRSGEHPIASLVDRFFNQPWLGWGGLPETSDRAPWIPADIHENDSSYQVSLEVPGMDAKDIHVQVRGDELTITGEKKSEHEQKDGGARCVECEYGAFERMIALPEAVDPKSIEAVYKRGVLTITVPKAKPTAATEVKIRAEGEAPGVKAQEVPVTSSGGGAAKAGR